MNLQKALRIYKELKNLDSNFVLAGSARRKKDEDLHDLDLIYVGSSIPNIPGLQVTVNGEKIVRGIYDGEALDIYLTDKKYLGGMLLYLTGPKKYGIKMRSKAKFKKFKLNQNGLFDRETGELIASETEEEIYAAMNLNYKEPELRV